MRAYASRLDLPIRAALLANLPRSGSVWPEEERQEWLRFAETRVQAGLFRGRVEDRAENKLAPPQREIARR